MANLTLFEKVYAKLRSEPQNFDMEEYVRDGRFCIGGAAILLSACYYSEKERMAYYKGRQYPPFRLAQELLQLTHEQADKIFYSCSWPLEYFSVLNSNDSPAEKVEAAIAHCREVLCQTT